MNPHNHSFSSPFNVNDAVNSSAPSHLSAGSAWDGSSTTSQGDVPAHSHDCVHNYVMSWSGLTPPQGLAPGHGPDYSSAWNNSPASLSNAFNAGYDMVSAWGGRTPNIGEAFIQGTLFAQRARPPFYVSGQSFPRPIAPTPAGPGQGCAGCGHNPSFAARSGPSVPLSVSPGCPGASGLNMPGAPRQPTPNVTVSPPPGFGTLGSPPVANTTPGFPFTSPPPPSFPFNPDMAGATAGQAPSVAPSSVARSTNPARVTVSSEVNVSPYPQVDSRSRSASFQRVARRDHRRRRSRSPAAYSRPCVPGASGRGSPEPRPAVPDTGRRVARQQPPAVAPPTRPQSRQQRPPGAASQTTNSSVGLQAAARPTSPWAIDPNEIPQRSTNTTFPEPSEEQGRLCPIAGCDNTSRLVRHATVQHLPWFSNPVTACWICGVQYVKGTKLKDHWRRHHRDVDISTNWGEHRFDDYFRRVESFVTSASALRRGEASLSEIYQEISMLDDFALLNAGVVCPGLGLFESFLTRHGETPVSQYRISPRPDSFACLLHWRVLLQLLVPLTPEQRQRVLDEHGGTPEQSEGQRLSPMRVDQPDEVLGATALPERTTLVSVAKPRTETGARSDEPAPNPPVTPLRESAAQRTVPVDKEQTVPMQVAQRAEVRSAPARPGRDNRAQVAKPRATTVARPVGAAPPRPRDPRREGSRQVTPRLVRPPVVRPAASVAAPLVARASGMLGVARGARPALMGSTRPSIARGRPPAPILAAARAPDPASDELEPRGARCLVNPSGARRRNDPRDYIDVDKILTESVVLTDAHFHLDKICHQLGRQRTELDAIRNRTDTLGANPTGDLPLKAVTCYMLNDRDMGYSMGQLLKMYRPFNRSPDIKLSFCYHPVQASLLDTPTKKYEAVEMCAEHLVMPGTVAAGEFGIDLHRNKTPEARHHSREFLSQMAKKLVEDTRFKALPLVLHVREVRDADEEAARQCISTLPMASVNSLRKIYIHCFVGTPETARFWIGNYRNVKFGVSPRVISHRPPCIEYFRTCPIRQLLIETDSPSLSFEHSLNPSPPTTPQSTYEVACWLARLREEPLQYVLESVRENFEEFYGF